MRASYKILPQDIVVKPCRRNTLQQTAVIAHLYYEDRFEHSMRYLRHVPGEIAVYLVTANPKLAAMARKTIEKERLQNITILLKPNRGRDYGALFVAAAEVLLQYEIIGFVHDKKSHMGNAAAMGEVWERCLFESTLASEAYILNVIGTFEAEPKLGLLHASFPPERYFLGMNGRLWTRNYEESVRFFRRIGLKNVPEKNDTPYVGSAMWFRTEAVQKLIEYGFKYEDFPEEPMPSDGTIAHVLERSFSYVVREAGYTDSFVVPNNYAEYVLEQKTEHMTGAMQVLRKADLIAYSDNQVDFGRSIEKLEGKYEKDGLIDYSTGFLRVFLLSSEKYAEKTEQCRDRLAQFHITVGGIFNTADINESILKTSSSGFIICTEGETKASYLDIMRHYGKKVFVFDASETFS